MEKIEIERHILYSDGRVFHKKLRRFLSGTLNGSGYLGIRIGKQTDFIHRIIAKAFIPNPNDKPQVNHKNGIKTDNRVENLEWVTPKGNVKHAIGIGLIKRARGEKSHLSKLKLWQVKAIRFFNEYYDYSTYDLAKIYHISQSQIWKIVTNKKWVI